MKKKIFVPTMGSLHEGHASLIKEASKIGDVTVSVFVNPTQFGPNEDFESYPRSKEDDFAYAISSGAKDVWFPTSDEIYPNGPSASEDSGELGLILEGSFRPGFFDGVLTVVKRLFEIIEPDIAVFGEKDWQQLVLIKEFSKIFNGPKIMSVKTKRDKNGLALSSRNSYLSKKGYLQSLYISKALLKVKTAWDEGLRDVRALEAIGIDFLSEKISKIDYLEVRPSFLLPKLDVLNQDARVLVAAWVEGTRLIDNEELTL
ncbi:pantoate--beta-alanine ligase [bacterium]|nr:pantoate--beta-alanine ligase [bacterium]|tara:strand:- start:2014 stop:2790 length:777 start_codon:yes stop_codon:yes gene_type:complete